MTRTKIYIKIFPSLIFFILIFHLSPAQQSWKEITTVAELYQSFPETIKGLLNHLDLDSPGLEKVKEASEKRDWVQAGENLLVYYRQSDHAAALRKDLPNPSKQTNASADTMLLDVFTIQNVRGKVPILPNGHRDWYYKGPNNDREWAWLSNRHSQIGTVMNAYFETGNPKYAEYIDLFLRDFIIMSMPFPGEKGTGSIWRGLEVAARAKVWSRVFYGLLNSEYLSPATRLLMLNSLPDHAHYSRNFHGGNNWLTMEISALATIAAYFPELKEADAWLDYSISAMTESMQDQVYPDGAQTELASHYHNVSLHNFELFKSICEQAGRKLPEYYTHTIEKMYGYIAKAVRPDGHRILNNDGDRGSDRELILQGAEKFNMSDWAYIASNGQKGKAPGEDPSYFFPWAGQLVSRSGFDASAHWSFFDIGPWGSGHQHNDKLHLSISAYGTDFLVDAGRFAYTGAVAEKFRPYAKGSKGHNVFLIDGYGQGAGPTHATEPLDTKYVKITDSYDFASQSFDLFKEMEGEARHIRSLFYVRGEFWVVVDRIITDRPREITALWHWHPEIEVHTDGRRVTGRHENGNLFLFPVNKLKWDVQQIKGQEDPEIQGWYSPEYNVYEPNTTSQYTSEIDGSNNFVWVLFPSEFNIPEVETSILAENEREVRLQVKSEQNVWELTIPFMDNEGAEMVKNK